MKKETMVATSTATELVKAATVASVKQQNGNANIAKATTAQEDSDCGCPADEIKPSITVRAIIDGKETVIMPAFIDYNMEQPKKKEELLKLSNESKRLDVLFHFAEPSIFREEGYTLFDRNGEVILSSTPNVYVVCDTADSYWRIFLDNLLSNVQIHTFESVKEYAQTIGNTMLLSRGLNNVEKVGYAALATGNDAYNAAFRFAKKNNMNISNALTYLDMRMKAAETQIMMLGIKPKLTPTLGRSEEEAQEIFEQNRKTFGDKESKQRYAVRAVNALISNEKYGFEVVMEALRTIPANDIANAKLMNCGAKESCITSVLTEWIIELQREKETKTAA